MCASKAAPPLHHHKMASGGRYSVVIVERSVTISWDDRVGYRERAVAGAVGPVELFIQV